jgi:ABC-2 type transport system permease protein
MLARAYPRVIGGTRQLESTLLEILLPLIGTFAMVLVYRSLGAPSRYYGFVILGGVTLAFWQNVLWSMAVQFFWDRGVGNLEIYTAAPTGFTPVLLGMAMGGMYLVLTRSAATLILGFWLFGVPFDHGAVLPALGTFVLAVSALYCLGMMLASLFLFYGREAWHLASAMQEPVTFLSGMYFPVRALGAYVGGAASLVPLTLGLDAMRQLLFPGGFRFLPVGVEVALLLAQVIAYFALSQVALRFMEWRARAGGRLIMRWG